MESSEFALDLIKTGDLEGFAIFPHLLIENNNPCSDSLTEILYKSNEMMHMIVFSKWRHVVQGERTVIKRQRASWSGTACPIISDPCHQKERTN